MLMLADDLEAARYPPLSAPARRFGPATASTAPEDPFAGLVAPVGRRLDIVCLRPIHHVLEYEALFRMTAALRSRLPAAKLHLHLLSAMRDPAPFDLLPVDRVIRLLGHYGRGTLAAGLRRLAGRWGEPVVVLAPPPRWRRTVQAGPGAGPSPIWPVPLDFSTSGGDGRLGLNYPSHAADLDGAVASARFMAALLREAPRWRRAAGAPPPLSWRVAGHRLLIHQARFHLGDALWLTPLLRAIHARLHRPRITLVGPPIAAEALAANPLIDELLCYHPRDGEVGRQGVLAGLAGKSFDAALFAFARRHESAWLARAMAAAGVPRRINLEYHDLFLDSRRPHPDFTHEGWFYWGAVPSSRLLLHALDPLVRADRAVPAKLTPPAPRAGRTEPMGQDRPGPPPSAAVPVLPVSPAVAVLPADVALPAMTVVPAVAALPTMAALPVVAAARTAGGAEQPARRDGTRLEVYVTAEARRRAAELLTARGIGELPFAVLAPGGRSSARWPAASFGRLAAALAGELGLAVLIEGSPDETALLREVATAAAHPTLEDAAATTGPYVGSAGDVAAAPTGSLPIAVCQDPLDVLAALLERARLLVGNDSGPLHLAAALGVPSLYFSPHEKLAHSHPESTAACWALYDDQANDLRRITVEQALGALREMRRTGAQSPRDWLAANQGVPVRSG